MANSSLDPDNLPVGADRVLGRGHGTGSLGPSDSSDSGSDMQGAPPTDLDLTTARDAEDGNTAGPEFGEVGLDSGTDSAGTGERASAGQGDELRDGADIEVDHIESFPEKLDDSETPLPAHRRQP
ncbi:hypothetical protein AAKU55_002438 [Oxalobacteraceae bacterium GrIS 1.11]